MYSHLCSWNFLEELEYLKWCIIPFFYAHSGQFPFENQGHNLVFKVFRNLCRFFPTFTFRVLKVKGQICRWCKQAQLCDSLELMLIHITWKLHFSLLWVTAHVWVYIYMHKCLVYTYYIESECFELSKWRYKYTTGDRIWKSYTLHLLWKLKVMGKESLIMLEENLVIHLNNLNPSHHHMKSLTASCHD